jgi:hypothetical protein
MFSADHIDRVGRVVPGRRFPKLPHARVKNFPGKPSRVVPECHENRARRQIGMTEAYAHGLGAPAP